MTNIWVIAGVSFFLIATLLVSYRLGDAVYFAQKHWKASLFVLICVSTGALAGTNFRNMTMAPDIEVSDALSYVASFHQPSEERVLATIRNCQAFVTARLDGRTLPERSDSNPSLLHFVSAVPVDWDQCARTFGMNYWKHDIGINGENGGVALCRAYHEQKDFASSEVSNWCDTVFAGQTAQSRY